PNYNEELGKKRLKLAAILQMGYPGAPTIYYGDEAGVTGSKDPDDRRTYPWGHEDQQLISHYKKVGSIRMQHKELLAHGNIETVYAKGDVYVFARQYGNEVALIAVNRGDVNKTVELNVDGLIPNRTTLTDEVHDGYKMDVVNGKATITIPAMDGRMMFGTVSVQKPAAVTNLQATAGIGSAILTWQGQAPKYRIYQSTLKGAGYTLVKETTEASATMEPLANGTAYYFAVTAVDENGNESAKVETNRVVPHYPLSTGNIPSVTTLSNDVLDLSKAAQVEAKVSIENVTKNGLAEGLQGVLQVKGPNDSNWKEYKAVYQGQDGEANVFRATFTPLVAGAYTYRYAFTTNLGEDWVYTNEQSVTFTANENDRTAPATAIELKQPAVESGQVNLSWTFTDKNNDDAYMLVIERDGEIVYTTTMIGTSFTDYNVENGKEYTYVVKLYDRAGNVAVSNEVKVTPNIVMVKVTFKVKAPDYTPLDTRITIPNSLNGWNTGAWEMSRNGAVTPDWQFTTEVQEGETITYKYVKGGSWDQEGLADHTREDSADDDVSYYGYGAIGTDLKVTVHNEGNNTMVIQDRILRWIDRPVVVEDVQKQGAQVTIKGNAIKNGVLTMNNERVPIDDHMAFTYTFTPVNNQKEIAIHIEPSEGSKSTIFKNDGGAIAKNTRDYVLNLETKQLREGTLATTPGSETTPGSGTTSGSGTTPGSGTMPVRIEGGKVVLTPSINVIEKDGKIIEKLATIDLNSVDAVVSQVSDQQKEVIVSVGMVAKDVAAKVEMPSGLLEKIARKTAGAVVIAQTDQTMYKLPVTEVQSVLPQIAKQLGVDIAQVRITIEMKTVDAPNLPVKMVSNAAEFRVIASANGKEQEIDRFKQYAEREITVDKPFEAARAVAVRINSDGTWVAVPTTFVGNKATVKSLTNSTYVIVEGNSLFTDIKKHWAKSYIDTLAAKQIIKGKSAAVYAPEENLTRAQFVVLLVRALGLPSETYDGRFKDVKGNEWFNQSGELMAAVQHGIIHGKLDGTFAPNEPITRAQAAVMMARAMKLSFIAYDFTQLNREKKVTDFKDVQQIDSWAKQAVEMIYQAGIVQGKEDGSFDPNGSMTRAQMAKILAGFLAKAKLM
ncbi:MAG: S-layer homology domain-containing protein, partial [Anoxybacillus ayderensis]|nr:S-layer homology domain-containing protein [Anoxybacillus ayderensis]